MDKTILKGLYVLETLAASTRPLGVSELSRVLGITKSNTYRTLQTLIHAGYARQDPESQAYECTLKLFEVASMVTGRLDVRQKADPYLQQLAHDTHETIHLSVLDGLEVIYISKIESAQPVRAYSAIGGRAPAYCVASGKALLAWQPKEWLNALPDELEPWTPKTLVTRDDLLDELAETRKRGFSVNQGEWNATVGGVAAPVFDALGKPVASIGISGPLERLTLSVQLAQGPLVTQAARGLSQVLGSPS